MSSRNSQNNEGIPKIIGVSGPPPIEILENPAGENYLFPITACFYVALQNGDSVCLVGPFYEYMVQLEQYDGHIPNAVLIEDDADE